MLRTHPDSDFLPRAGNGWLEGHYVYKCFCANLAMVVNPGINSLSC